MGHGDGEKDGVVGGVAGRVLAGLESAQGVGRDDRDELARRLDRLRRRGGTFASVEVSEELMTCA
ncbi:MAG: hypothetical protein ACYTGH_20330 [Planctomycetota bacterium]